MSGEERYDWFMDDWKGWEVNQGSVGEMLGGIDRRKGCNEECGGGTVHQLVATVVHNRTAKATGEWKKKRVTETHGVFSLTRPSGNSSQEQVTGSEDNREHVNHLGRGRGLTQCFEGVNEWFQ